MHYTATLICYRPVNSHGIQTSHCGRTLMLQSNFAAYNIHKTVHGKKMVSSVYIVLNGVQLRNDVKLSSVQETRSSVQN